MRIRIRTLAILAPLALVFQTATVSAHDGRRFEVKVVDGQLFVQGYISNGGSDEGGNPRPYHNVLHDHWKNIPGPTTAAIADLPGFNVFSTTDSYVNANGYSGGGVAELLQGEDLTITLLSASKWQDPPAAQPFGVPNLVPLSPNELITIGNGLGSVDTDHPGTLTLAQNIAASGAVDIDIDYTIGLEPTGSLYALEWKLSTTANGIRDSQSIYTILSPDPDPLDTGINNPMMGMHHHSLHLEQHLSLPIPEPGSVALIAIGIPLLIRVARRERRRT